jgi:RNA binding exosome subunit
MTKEVHNITVTVFEKNEEKIERHKEIFHFLLPVDFEKQKVDVSVESIEGLNHELIYIIRLKTMKNSHNGLLLDMIFSQLSELDRKQLSDQYLSRLNQEGFFFIRLDKEDLLQKKFVLTDSGDCYHFKIKIASFPAKWDAFVKSTESLLIKYHCMKNKTK